MNFTDIQQNKKHQAFSVLMSLYFKEQADYLSQSLSSIFNQTVLPSEVILVLDGPISSDLQTIVKDFESRHEEIKVISLPINKGLGNALNEGLKHCTCEIVARMDTDDIAKQDRFEKQLAVFGRFPNVDVVSSWIDEFIGTVDNVISTRKLPEYQFELYRYAKRRCPVNHPAVMFKRDSVLFAGGYRHFPLFEDYHLWVRLLLNGSHFYNIQESLLFFRTSEDMYKRRGGLKHGLNEIKFQSLLCRMGFINPLRCITNIGIRFTTRIIPNRLREVIYQKLLRR